MIKSELCDRVLKLELSNPPVNVLDTAMLNELAAAVNGASADASAILLCGAGKCFSAGASVQEHAPELVDQMLAALTNACLALQDAAVPVVAMVHGACFGGALELAAFCDFIVADPQATFGVPEVQLGFFPPLACARLHTLCGRGNAAGLVFTGEGITVERAAAIGLVYQIKPIAEWDEVVRRFNGLSQPVLRLAKQAFNQGAGPSDPALLTSLNELFVDELYKTEDVQEGLTSFQEKRKPDWKHR